jgi:hypothetical protein
MAYHGNGRFILEGEEKTFSKILLILGRSGITPGNALIARILGLTRMIRHSLGLLVRISQRTKYYWKSGCSSFARSMGGTSRYDMCPVV